MENTYYISIFKRIKKSLQFKDDCRRLSSQQYFPWKCSLGGWIFVFFLHSYTFNGVIITSGWSLSNPPEKILSWVRSPPPFWQGQDFKATATETRPQGISQGFLLGWLRLWLSKKKKMISEAKMRLRWGTWLVSVRLVGCLESNCTKKGCKHFKFENHYFCMCTS